MVKAFRGKDWAILESEKLGAFGERLHFAEQHTPEGFGHAVYQAKKFVGDEPFLLLLGDHVYISDIKDRCARQLITRVRAVHARRRHRRAADARAACCTCSARSAAQPIDAGEGHLQGRADHREAVDRSWPARSSPRPACRRGITSPTSACTSSRPRIFDSLEYLIKNDLREKGRDPTHRRPGTPAAADATSTGCVVTQGQRYDTGIPYGLMETQLALALNGIHRTEICEAIARILAMQVKQ